VGRHMKEASALSGRLFCLLMCFAAGCSNSGRPPKNPVPEPLVIENPEDDADDPMVKEAREETEFILKNVLSGKTGDDSGLAQIAAKVKGFESWTIDKQELKPGEPKTATFTGVLTGPGGEATFKVSMTKQINGKWAIGTFQGPNPFEK
jgi:hypothetical protein